MEPHARDALGGPQTFPDLVVALHGTGEGAKHLLGKTPHLTNNQGWKVTKLIFGARADGNKQLINHSKATFFLKVTLKKLLSD